jgi:hypothetical protein
MAYLAVDNDTREYKCNFLPIRHSVGALIIPDGFSFNDVEELPKGSIKKPIGRELTWEDEPVEVSDDSHLSEVQYLLKYGSFKTPNLSFIKKETILEVAKETLEERIKKIKDDLKEES